MKECNKNDINVRKVKSLGDRARKKAEEMNLKDDDLVIVETEIIEGRPPRYELTKIEGSPTEFIKENILKSNSNKDDNRRSEVWK